jgi:hypothetical protein
MRLAWDLSHSSAATQLVKVYLAGPDTILVTAPPAITSN